MDMLLPFSYSHLRDDVLVKDLQLFCFSVGFYNFICSMSVLCNHYVASRSQWPHGLRCRSAAARLLRLWVRIPLEHGCLSVVCVVCCQVGVSASG